MAIQNVRQLIDAELAGKTRRYTWRKSPSSVTPPGRWFDLSMSTGHPKAKLWFDASPLVAQQVKQSTDGGIFHGANVSPASKRLRLLTTLTVNSTALPLTMILCDYLLYYPTVDESITDQQDTDNTLTLPRYTDGDGVMVIAVTLASRASNPTFTFSYTNQSGVAGRTSPTITLDSSSVIGSIASSQTALAGAANPFLPLQEGDTGVRSIESVTMGSTDSGLFALVLVKPLANTSIKEITAPYENDLFLSYGIMPEIKDDAFLNYLCLPKNSLSTTTIIGDLKVVWS